MTSQGRRKHSECLFRMRESCPLRKLRRNGCRDSRSSLAPAGEPWGGCHVTARAQVGPVAPLGNQATCVRTCSKTLQFTAMNTDVEPPTARPMASDIEETYSRFIQQCHATPINACLDLSGVDPETGERAQR